MRRRPVGSPSFCVGRPPLDALADGLRGRLLCHCEQPQRAARLTVTLASVSAALRPTSSCTPLRAGRGHFSSRRTPFPDSSRDRRRTSAVPGPCRSDAAATNTSAPTTAASETRRFQRQIQPCALTSAPRTYEEDAAVPPDGIRHETHAELVRNAFGERDAQLGSTSRADLSILAEESRIGVLGARGCPALSNASASIRMTRTRRASSARILSPRTRRWSSVRSPRVNVSAIWRDRMPVPCFSLYKPLVFPHGARDIGEAGQSPDCASPRRTYYCLSCRIGNARKS